MKKTTVMMACSVQSVYGGNFIASLMNLEKRLNSLNTEVVYVFPPKAGERHWCKKMIEMGKTVEFCDDMQNLESMKSELYELAVKHSCDIIHTHFGSYLNALGQCRKLLPNMRFFIHMHSDFTGGKSDIKGFALLKRDCRNLARRILKPNANARTKYIFVSDTYLKKMKRAYGLPKSKCVYIPNALAPERFCDVSLNRQEARSRLKISDDEIVLLMFGWHIEIKGVDIAMKALKIARETMPQLRLALVHGTKKEHMENLMKCASEIFGAPLEESGVLLLPPTEDVFAYHRACDIFLSASRSEGLPYSFIETMSVGKPIVTSRIDGTLWAEEFSLTDYFESENEHDCARAILEAARKLPPPEKAVRQAEMLIKEKYDIEDWSKKIAREYGLL